MGMYNEVVCEYPLPDGYDATGIVFQTDSLGSGGDRFTITRDGYLLTEYSCVFVMDGEVVFHYTNGVYGSGGYYATVDDQPLRMWRYVVTFQRGRVLGVTGGAEELEGTRLPVAGFWSAVERVR